MPSPGRRFAEALAAKDTDALRSLLVDDLDFRGLTPRREWVGSTQDEFLDAAFGSWFDDGDHLEGVEVSEGAPVVDTDHVSYRLAIASGGAPYTCEQQAYYRTSEGRITWLRVLCSGFRPTQ